MRCLRSGALFGTLAPLLALALAAAGFARPHKEPLAALRARIEAGEIPNVHAVLVSQHGRQVAEWYFRGPDERRGQSLGDVDFDVDTLHDIRSATKSVVSILLGIALAAEAIPSIDAPVLDYFPEHADLQTEERRKISLRHLLSMTSGLHWDEESHPYTDPRNSETAMDLAPDRLRYVLSQPIDAAPGTQFRYSGGDVALIAAVIERATRTSLDDYAREKLFAPLGVTAFEWLKDDRSVPIAASGLRLRPRDMMKIGQLMLDGGRSGDQRILPQEWVAQSVAPHAVVDRQPGCGTDYGYFWWLGPACPATGEPAWFSAIGNGGQRIFVVAEFDLVIVVTAGLYNDRRQRLIRDITAGAIAWASQAAK